MLNIKAASKSLFIVYTMQNNGSTGVCLERNVINMEEKEVILTQEGYDKLEKIVATTDINNNIVDIKLIT